MEIANTKTKRVNGRPGGKSQVTSSEQKNLEKKLTQMRETLAQYPFKFDKSKS